MKDDPEDEEAPAMPTTARVLSRVLEPRTANDDPSSGAAAGDERGHDRVTTRDEGRCGGGEGISATSKARNYYANKSQGITEGTRKRADRPCHEPRTNSRPRK